MKEKKLTDEEIVKALECCTVDEVTDCENCPLLRESCAIIRKYALDLINRQKAEIERLGKVETELQDLNIEYYNDAKDLRRENKDLQKQVDELKEERENMQSVIFELEEDKRLLQKQVDELKLDLENWKKAAYGYKYAEKQAVKDTAKEILEYGTFLMPIRMREWIKKRYGVEVE